MKIRAVLFDMDGVLIEAKDWHYEALNRALAIFGMEISRYDHLVTYDGLPTKRKLEMLSKERGLPTALHQFISKMKQMYTLQIIHASCRPRFAHEYALSLLKKEGYRIAVCSNSIRETIELMMEKACLKPYLDQVVSNEDVTKGKPDPEMYIKAISAFGLKPEQCLIIEDNPNGIQAAIASGGHVMPVLGIEEVTYLNITQRIKAIESGKPNVTQAKIIEVQSHLDPTSSGRKDGPIKLARRA